MDESTLRQQACEALQTGKLPHRRPERMWGGPGTGAACTICGKPLQPEEMGFELEFAFDGEHTGVVNHQVHVRCFAAWEFERDDVETSRGLDSAEAGVALGPRP